MTGRIVLLVLGIAAYAVMVEHVQPFDDPSQMQLVGQIVALLAAVGVCFVPRGREALDRPCGNGPHAAVWAVAGISAGYFLVSATIEGRWNAPAIHDEMMYRLQATMLAHGRLWMPQHPLADFFDTFHVLVKPVYAAMSFPGTAIFYVPAVWVGVPFWVVSVAIAGGVVAVIYLLGVELFDVRVGVIAALLAMAAPGMRTQSIEILPYQPALLLELGTVWAWLNWRKNGDTAWAAVGGILAGWAMITRPPDALCYLVPIGVAIVWRMGQLPRKTRIRTAVAAVALAAPFLILQLAFDRGVTGHFLQTPYSLGLRYTTPGLEFSLSRHLDQNVRPASSLPQVQDYYTDWLLPMMKEDHSLPLQDLWMRNLANVAQQGMASPKFTVLFPAALIVLASRKGWVILATVPLFLLLYTFYGVFIAAYALFPLGAVAIGVAASPGVLGFNRISRAGLMVVVAGIGVACLLPPKLERAATPELPVIDQILADRVHPPAVVLFRYAKGVDFHQEPVYNAEVCWPDDAPIIRAQDLGDRDGELIRYYARVQPDRKIYVYDRATRDLQQIAPLSAN